MCGPDSSSTLAGLVRERGVVCVKVMVRPPVSLQSRLCLPEMLELYKSGVFMWLKVLYMKLHMTAIPSTFLSLLLSFSFLILLSQKALCTCLKSESVNKRPFDVFFYSSCTFIAV